MTAPTLIIMAAGIGSRYGGLKQVDPIGPNGEIIIDYSIYDALEAGFEKVVFLIRRDIEEVFREKIGRKIEKRVETAYTFQDLDAIPVGFSVPPERKKPWGTGHAVLCCRQAVQTPFAAINADDFYGKKAFNILGSYLKSLTESEITATPCPFSMVGYVLQNTLSEHGSVARGICQTTPDGYLAGIQEHTRIEPVGGVIRTTENGLDWIELPAESTVSMNMWGFTPSLFPELEQRFKAFFESNAANLAKSEFFLPNVVNELLVEGKTRVKILPTREKWFGVTYPDDRPLVQAAIQRLIAQGHYPSNLWGA
jgi:dTDP-glucose pyrophosphorylase